MVVELRRHGVEAFSAVACHGIDITDETAREMVDDFRVKGLVCSFAYSSVGRAGGTGRWSFWRWNSSVQEVGHGVRTGLGAEQELEEGRSCILGDGAHLRLALCRL